MNKTQKPLDTDFQIKVCWILCGIASLTAWLYAPAYALFAAVIFLMLKRICTENDHGKFENASLLLMAANSGLLLSVMLAAMLGHGLRIAH